MTRRAASLLAFLVGTFIVSTACGRERPGDALLAQALQRHARTAATLQRDLLSAAEKAAGPDRFDAYWTYNLAVGTWRQVAGFTGTGKAKAHGQDGNPFCVVKDLAR